MVSTDSRWKRLFGSRLWDAAAVAVAIVSIVRLLVSLPSPLGKMDFAHYYVGGRLTLEGVNPYAVALGPYYVKFGFTFQPYEASLTATPLFMRLFSLLAWMPPAVAYDVLLLLQAAWVWAVLVMTYRLLGDRLSVRARRFVGAAAITSVPVCASLANGHPELLLVVMVLGALSLHRAGRQAAACAVVTGAGLLKLFPFVLLPWFIWRGDRGWRGRCQRAAAAAGVVLLLVAVSGPKLWWEYMSRPVSVLLQHSMAPGAFSFSVTTMVAMLGYAAHRDAEPASLVTAWTIGSCLGLGLLGLAYWACLRWNADDEAQFCLLSVAMLAAGGFTWGYYFVFLIFPMAAAVARAATRRSAAGILGVGAAYFMVNLMRGHLVLDSQPCWRVVSHFAPLYGLLGLGAFWVFELRNRDREGAAKALIAR